MSEKFFGEYLQIKSDLICEALDLKKLADNCLELFNKINCDNIKANQGNLCSALDDLEDSYISIVALYGKLFELINRKKV